MSGTVPTNYSNKATIVDADSAWGYDSEAIDNVNFTFFAIFNYITGKATTDNISEGTTNLYYTDNRFDTRLGTKTTDDLTEGTTNKYATTSSVNAAGATMNTDTSLAGNSYFLDEDDMASNDPNKAASQQSIKTYVDSKALPINGNLGSKSATNSSRPGISVSDSIQFTSRTIAVATLSVAGAGDGVSKIEYSIDNINWNTLYNKIALGDYSVTFGVGDNYYYRCYAESVNATGSTATTTLQYTT